MFICKYFITYLAIFVALFALPSLALETPQGTAAYESLDQQIKDSISRGKVIGCAVAVVDGGKITFMRAYGKQKKGSKDSVNLDTVFQLGSISKPITATLFAVAQRKDFIHLNAPAMQTGIQVLPDTQMRHLLSHTAGFSRAGWNSNIEVGWPREKLLRHLSLSPQSRPGQAFDYHNLVFSLLEDALSKAFNMPFDKALQQHLFKPLKMSRTTVGFENFFGQKNRAWPHVVKRRRGLQPREYSYRYHENVAASAGVNSSIKDMAQFLQLQLGQFPQVLGTHDLAVFHSPVTLAKDARRWFKKYLGENYTSFYGHGWRVLDVNGQQIVFHGGWVGGFINFLAFIPSQQLGIVVLNNSETNFSLEMALSFLSSKIKNQQNNQSILASKSH